MDRERWTVPIDELEGSARIDAAVQGTTATSPAPPHDLPGLPLPFADGATGPDADGD
jgi:hypothetical protein